MKINNIELTPITYSYYNQVRLKRKLKLSILYEISNHLQALIDPSNWPSLEQDKWAKFKLIWKVIWAFKCSLKLKKEREKKKRIRSKKKDSSEIKTANIKFKIQSTQNAINFNINSKEKSIIMQNKNHFIDDNKKDKLIEKRKINYHINDEKIKIKFEVNFDSTFELIKILLKNGSLNLYETCFNNDLISKNLFLAKYQYHN